MRADNRKQFLLRKLEVMQQATDRAVASGNMYAIETAVKAYRESAAQIRFELAAANMSDEVQDDEADAFLKELNQLDAQLRDATEYLDQQKRALDPQRGYPQSYLRSPTMPRDTLAGKPRSENIERVRAVDDREQMRQFQELRRQQDYRLELERRARAFGRDPIVSVDEMKGLTLDEMKRNALRTGSITGKPPETPPAGKRRYVLDEDED